MACFVFASNAVVAQDSRFHAPETVVTAGFTWGANVTAGGLEMYFTDYNNDDWQISRITRDSVDSEWPDSLGEPVDEFNRFGSTDIVSFTEDGLTAVYTRGNSLYQASRDSLEAEWTGARSISGGNAWGPSLSADGLSVVYTRNMWDDRSADLYMATRDSLDDRFGTATPLAEINTPTFRESSANLSPDGLTLFFTSDRPGGQGLEDIWSASRKSIDEPFGTPSNVGPEINTPNSDWTGFVDANGTLFHTRNAVRGDCCWYISQAEPNENFRVVGGPDATGVLTLPPSSREDVVFEQTDQLQPGLLQHWFSRPQLRGLSRVESIVETAEPDVAAFHGDNSWWSGTFDGITGLHSYPPEVVGGDRGGRDRGHNWNSVNNERYSVILTGEIFIPESGSYEFVDGVYGYAGLAIDANRDGEFSVDERLIDDNEPTDPIREANDGGLPGDFTPQMDFDQIASGGEWFPVLAAADANDGADSGLFYWDYDTQDSNGNGVRVGDAVGFPEWPGGIGGFVEESDIPNLLIPDSHLRSSGGYTLAGGTLVAELANDGFAYVLEITSTGDSDALVVDNDSELLRTKIELNNATLSVQALGDLNPGEYTLIDADEISGTANWVFSEELATQINTNRLDSLGILVVLGDSPLDCNVDDELSIVDTTCISAVDLADLLTEAGLIQGDADGNGTVGFEDFLALSDHFGQQGTYIEGDFDVNGSIDFADFLLLSSNFGSTSASLASVPEPSQVAWLFVLLTALAIRPGLKK